jgi:hypothetical protein
MTAERKSFFVYRSRIYKEKAQNKVAKLRRKSREKKKIPREYCIFAR